MQARATLLSAAALGFALLGGPTRAADLPKEGTITATYSAAGTYKATPLGEERWFNSWEEHGLTVGDGLFDHITWHCWGVDDGMKTIATARGYCVGTAPTGDQIAAEVATDGKVDLTKVYTVTDTFTDGTGKYAGISGGFSATCHSSEFKAPEVQYAQYCSHKGSYKLP